MWGRSSFLKFGSPLASHCEHLDGMNFRSQVGDILKEEEVTPHTPHTTVALKPFTMALGKY